MMTHSLAPWLWTLVDISALFGAALLAHAFLGQARPLARSALWNATLLAALLIPMAVVGLPRVRLPLLPAQAQSQASVPPLSVETGQSTPVGSFARSPSLASTDRSSAPLSHEEAASRNAGEQTVDRNPGSTGLVVGFILTVYALGASFLIVRLIAEIIAVRCLKRSAQLVMNPRWTGSLSHWRNRLHLARSVILLKSDKARVPLALVVHLSLNVGHW